MEYETVIGLEVHAQLLTESKMFCSCSAGYQDSEPNTDVCEICLGMPGVLPVINRRAVEIAISTGLALNCDISETTKFDRKNYPYPDLMKGYQISQYDQPIATRGFLVIEVEGVRKTIGITRVHLEEDVAKLSHRKDMEGTNYSLLDINRSGVPLMETVTEPDMRTPEEARAYLMSLRSILRYIEASTANMEEGSFRCDANISIRPEGSTELGTKVEVKNMNSFRSVYNALVFETERQGQLLQQGRRIIQETRGWEEDKEITVSQRSKEQASDYRYFPEPDLPPLQIKPEWLAKLRDKLPELPNNRKERFVSEYGLPYYDSGLLTASKATADYFEAVLNEKFSQGDNQQVVSKMISNWILGEMTRYLNDTGTEIKDVLIRPKEMVELLEMLDEGTLSTNMARTVFGIMFETGRSPKNIAEERGMVQLSDPEAILPAVSRVLSANPRPVADYLAGKEAVLRFLVGQVMKETKGKANPLFTSDILKEKLDSMR